MRVLDAYSLLAYLQEELGKEKMIEVFRFTRESGFPLLLSTVNWGEVFYTTLRRAGRERAEYLMNLIAKLPIEVVPADLELARQAAIFKASKKMSYADCFAAALAKLRKAELVTGDKEFAQLEPEVKILWL